MKYLLDSAGSEFSVKFLAVGLFNIYVFLFFFNLNQRVSGKRLFFTERGFQKIILYWLILLSFLN